MQHSLTYYNCSGDFLTSCWYERHAKRRKNADMFSNNNYTSQVDSAENQGLFDNVTRALYNPPALDSNLRRSNWGCGGEDGIIKDLNLNLLFATLAFHFKLTHILCLRGCCTSNCSKQCVVNCN